LSSRLRIVMLAMVESFAIDEINIIIDCTCGKGVRRQAESG